MNSPELYLAALFNHCFPALNWQGPIRGNFDFLTICLTNQRQLWDRVSEGQSEGHKQRPGQFVRNEHVNICHCSKESWIKHPQFCLFLFRCLSERLGEVEVACSDVLQVTKSDVQTNMIIIVAVILSITGTESQNFTSPVNSVLSWKAEQGMITS